MGTNGDRYRAAYQIFRKANYNSQRIMGITPLSDFTNMMTKMSQCELINYAVIEIAIQPFLLLLKVYKWCDVRFFFELGCRKSVLYFGVIEISSELLG